MSHRAQNKGAKANRGARHGAISKARANRSQKLKVLPMEVILGDQPLKSEKSGKA